MLFSLSGYSSYSNINSHVLCQLLFACAFITFAYFVDCAEKAQFQFLAEQFA